MIKKFIRPCVYACWLVLAVAALLLLAEYASHELFPKLVSRWQDRVQTWQYDPLLGWRQKPGINTVVNHPDATIAVSTNSFGLRAREYPLQRTGKKRMLVIGDSFVWGYGVQAEQRFTDVLEQRHPDWEIINAGVTGYGTDQEYLFYSHALYRYNPDVVVVLLYYNDFENNFSAEQYWYFKPYYTLDNEKSGNNRLVLHNNPVPESTLSQRIDRYIETDTIVLTRLRQLYWFASNVAHNMFQHYVLGKEPETVYLGFTRFADSLPLTDAILLQFRDEVIQHHSRFVLFGVPIRPGLKQNLDQLAQREHLDYLNLDPYFAGHEQDDQLPNDEHWNASGHRRAADVMEQYFRKIGVF